MSARGPARTVVVAPSLPAARRVALPAVAGGLHDTAGPGGQKRKFIFRLVCAGWSMLLVSTWTACRIFSMLCGNIFLDCCWLFVHFQFTVCCIFLAVVSLCSKENVPMLNFFVRWFSGLEPFADSQCFETVYWYWWENVYDVIADFFLEFSAGDASCCLHSREWVYCRIYSMSLYLLSVHERFAFTRFFLNGKFPGIQSELFETQAWGFHIAVWQGTLAANF